MVVVVLAVVVCGRRAAVMNWCSGVVVVGVFVAGCSCRHSPDRGRSPPLSLSSSSKLPVFVFVFFFCVFVHGVSLLLRYI